MAETPMCPAEVMARAAWEELGSVSWEDFKRHDPAGARGRIQKQRAALRALAEMEPTEKMSKAAERAYIETLSKPVSEDIVAKAYIFAAAAEEGESS